MTITDKELYNLNINKEEWNKISRKKSNSPGFKKNGKMILAKIMFPYSSVCNVKVKEKLTRFSKLKHKTQKQTKITHAIDENDSHAEKGTGFPTSFIRNKILNRKPSCTRIFIFFLRI